MEAEYTEVYDLRDAGGGVLYNQMRVDGMRIPTFRKPPGVTAAIFRNIKHLKIREDDILLCTPVKSGTHWCFEILTMLLNGTTELSDIQKIFLMLINVHEEELDKMKSPRILNTHFPFRMLPIQMKEKKTKIVLVLRNPKDVAVSLYYHHTGMTNYYYNGKFSDHLKLFMEGRLMYNSWFDYVLEFEKALNAEPHRIHLVYYEDLKENGVEEIARIAKFLGVPAAVDAELIETINEKCQFKSMKEGKMYSPELAKKMFVDPSKFNIYRKGEIGDWKNHFTVAENEAFDKLYQEKMKTSKLKFRFEPSAK
ncbi:sulfotransferase 1B1-like isoform X1 [Mercenaria mercenaria]|uniref:sulfotransferase 1B1-like isoform X1 n=1 Tax=Mercenaria mercenaria TaxID=6596 RepID=UPI00234F1771|nr:sulfotransferase 1B1-like isoform X1 [Mercenaria mercenaria]